MPDRTNNQILSDYVERLGEEFGNDFRRIETNYYELRVFWRLYRSFFGANEERVNLFNSVSGLTAWAIEHALLEQCILRLTRLLDPESSGRNGVNRNLTFSRINSHVLASRIENNDEFSNLLAEAHSAGQSLRDWRNRQTAHLDLDVAHNRAELAPLTRRDMHIAIEKCGDLIQWILLVFFDSSSELDPHLPFHDDEMVFLKTLYAGHSLLEAEFEGFRLAIDNETLPEPHRREFPEWLTERYEQLRVRLRDEL
jgi:AbiU2